MVPLHARFTLPCPPGALVTFCANGYWHLLMFKEHEELSRPALAYFTAVQQQPTMELVTTYTEACQHRHSRHAYSCKTEAGPIPHVEDLQVGLEQVGGRRFLRC